MTESSSHNSSSPEITPKEEPITLDKPESPNPFLPTDQEKIPFGLRMGGLRTGEEGYVIKPPVEFMSAKDTIAVQLCGLLARELNEFLSSYPIPLEYDVILPTSTQTIFDALPGYVGLYTHSFSLANLRLPLTDFFYEVLQYFKVYISRLNPIGYAKLTTFIIMCKAYGCEPYVDRFRGFFNLMSGCGLGLLLPTQQNFNLISLCTRISGWCYRLGGMGPVVVGEVL
ncbi:hypothetical protein Tco_0294259 [Tanacetum coccineum]